MESLSDITSLSALLSQVEALSNVGGVDQGSTGRGYRGGPLLTSPSQIGQAAVVGAAESHQPAAAHSEVTQQGNRPQNKDIWSMAEVSSAAQNGHKSVTGPDTRRRPECAPDGCDL